MTLVEAKRPGKPATSARAMDAAKQRRWHINDRFYELQSEVHRNLSAHVRPRPEVHKTYEDLEPGLAQYVRDAIHANPDRSTQ